jgi:hypothetical protein
MGRLLKAASGQGRLLKAASGQGRLLKAASGQYKTDSTVGMRINGLGAEKETQYSNGSL